MKVLINLLILFFCFSITSCQENQEKEVEKRSITISKSGGVVLYKSNDDKKIIYQKDQNVILDDLEKEVILYSDTSHYVMKEYYADFLSDGEITINSFDPENILLSEKIKDNYKNFNECNVRCINGDFLFIDDYLICIENPHIVYNGLYFQDRLDTKGNLAVCIFGDFTKYPNNDYKFELLEPMIFYRGGCRFTWEIIIDRKGEIISKADEISTYGTDIPIKDLTRYHAVETKHMPLIELAMYINENIE